MFLVTNWNGSIVDVTFGGWLAPATCIRVLQISFSEQFAQLYFCLTTTLYYQSRHYDCTVDVHTYIHTYMHAYMCGQFKVYR